jgi:hypothetical protein
MSNEFMKSSAAVETAVNKATSHEELRESMLAVLAQQGAVARTRDEGVRVIPQPEVFVPSASLADHPAEHANTARFYRVIYPHDNDRFELTGNSEAELDERERQIRAMYQR